MHPSYEATVADIRTWCQRETGVQGALVLGSQVRETSPGDAWSDLDLLLLADDPPALLRSDAWLAFLGPAVCAIVEETPLPWCGLAWSVKRVLLADNRAVDFSIVPAERLDDVLRINAEIHAQGYEVLYDDHPPALATRVARSVAAYREALPQAPTAEDVRRTVDDLLFQLIWAGKKIKRGELWVAVRCINQTVSNRLLQLVEYYTTAAGWTTPQLAYEGRFLEQRTPQDVLDRLTRCFARYDAADAIRTVHHLLDLAAWLVVAICEAYHYPFPASQFAALRRLYAEMFGVA